MRRQRPAGFTLIEFMIAVFISSIIFGVGLFTITSTQRAQQSSAANLRMAENARYLFDIIERDLSGAYPVKFPDIAVPPQTGFEIQNRAQLITVNTPPSTPESDCIAFIAKADHANSPDSVNYVRYFVIQNTRFKERTTICRELIPAYYIPGYTLTGFDPITAASGGHSALFDGVRSVQFLYRQWQPDAKKFEPDLNNNNQGDPTRATHILVRLFMRDPDGNPTPRLYQKAIPLPQAFLD